MTTAAPTRRAHLWRRRLTRAALCILLGAVTTVGVAWAFVLSRRTELFGVFESVFSRYDPNNHRGAWPSPIPEEWLRANPEPLIHTEAPLGLTIRRACEAIPPDLPQGMYVNSEFMTHLYQLTLDAGWPARAVTLHRNETSSLVDPAPVPPTVPAGLWEDARAAIGVAWDHPDGGLRIPTAQPPAAQRPSYLPVVLMWPGFPLNTLFYAATWWIMLAMPGAVKRWRRKRRGRCVACGYDLRGLGGTVLRTVMDGDASDEEDTARRAVPPGGVVVCPECGRDVAAKTPAGRRARALPLCAQGRSPLPDGRGSD